MPEARNPTTPPRTRPKGRPRTGARRLPNGDYLRADGTLLQRVTLYLAPDVVRALKVRAAEGGTSMSDYAAAALDAAAGAVSPS